MKIMKRILFCGNVYGAGNIGDDAILEGLVTSFRRLEENIEIGAISMCPSHTKATIDIDYVWSNTLKSEREAINWATHIILGGGTLLTDSQNIRYPLQHCCRIIDHAINCRKPISMLAAGASDINRIAAKGLLDKYINRYLDIITVRSDFDKIQAVNNGGINENLLNIGADGAFALNISAKWQPENIIGISLVSEGNDSIGYPQRVANAINRFQEQHPLFKYMGICSEVRKESQFDYPLIKFTLDSINGIWSIQDDYKSPQEFIKFLSQFNFVLTMRMHILVFCCLKGIPCIAIVREQKMQNMLNSLGIEEYLRMDSNEEEIFKTFQLAVTEPEKFLPNASKLETLKRLSVNNLDVWVEQYEHTTNYKTTTAGIIKRCSAKWNTSTPKHLVIFSISHIKLFIKRLLFRSQA